MFQTCSIPFWTAITALAGVGQVVVLIVTARFVFRYLQETEAMRKATEKQVGKSQELVILGNRQMEGQSKPILVARKGILQINDRIISHRPMVELVNIGRGPALDVKISAVPTKWLEQWDGSEKQFEREPNLAFIEPGQARLTYVNLRDVAGVGGLQILGQRGFRCEYTSVSGRTYSTIADFDGDNVTGTSFSIYPEAD